MRIKKELDIFVKQIGNDTWKFIKLSIVVGFFLFLCELLFVYSFQNFLYSIGLLDQKLKIDIPDYISSSLSLSVVILLACGFFRAFIYGCKTFMANMTQHTFMNTQRKELLHITLNNCQKVSTNDVVSIFSDVVTSSGVLVNSISVLVLNTISAIFYFLSALYLAPIETTSGIFLVCVFLLPLRRLTRKVNSLGDSLVKEWEQINSSLLIGIRNNFFLKIYDLLGGEVEKGQRHIDNYKSHVRQFSIISATVIGLPPFIGLTVLVGASYIGVNFLQTNPAKLLSFFYIFLRMVQSLSEMNQTFTTCKLNWPGFKHLNSWKDKVKFDIKNDDIKSTLVDTDISKIEMNIDNFQYDSRFSLNNINFTISKGDVLVIKGSSGSGKSTLLSLLLGVNQLPENGGNIRINDNTTNGPFIFSSNRISYVGPDPFLIEGTIKENLHYGNNKEIPEDLIWNVLEKVSLTDAINKMPNKLDQRLSEDSELSTGQRQRLSFARALLKDFDMLILDEATANLDHVSEDKIVKKLKDDYSDKIIIAVTHRTAFDQITTHDLDLNKIAKH